MIKCTTMTNTSVYTIDYKEQTDTGTRTFALNDEQLFEGVLLIGHCRCHVTYFVHILQEDCIRLTQQHAAGTGHIIQPCSSLPKYFHLINLI